MAVDERGEKREKPFEGLDVYYSGSIKGVPELDPEFAWQLVQYMIEGGANVSSEHVAARNQEERDEIRARRIGMDVEEMLANTEPWFDIREQDIKWVDQASHVVALVNSPSTGVGMEIQRAIDLMEFGIQKGKKILCLVHRSVLVENELSFMVRGIDPVRDPFCQVESYGGLEEARVITHNFLTGAE